MRRGLALFVGALSLVLACEDSGSGGAGGSGASGAANTGGVGGGGGEGAASSTATFPTPQVGGTAEADALASAPARCGQEDYSWLSGDQLGQITKRTSPASFTSNLLTALIEATGVDIGVTLQYNVDQHVISYTTQDRGAEVEATTLVMWPNNVPAGTTLPTLLLLHGTSGFTDGCGPSSNGEEHALYAAIASSGYVVVVPDYLGLKTAGEPATGFPHPYLAGQATAIASLDAVRTLRHLESDPALAKGLVPSPEVVVLGGSQGGHAALWVDRLAPYYARELQLLGIAATVPPSDLETQALLGLTEVRQSTGNMVAFWGASSSWYGLGSQLEEVFVPAIASQLLPALAASCDPSDAVDGIETLEAVFQPQVLSAATSGDLASLGPWGCMVLENGLTSTSVTRIQEDPASYGILFITGEQDQLVDTPTERAAFSTLCNGGLPMQYLECAGASHTKATAWSLPEILAFLQDRAAKTPFRPNCNVPAPSVCSATSE